MVCFFGIRGGFFIKIERLELADNIFAGGVGHRDVIIFVSRAI